MEAEHVFDLVQSLEAFFGSELSHSELLEMVEAAETDAIRHRQSD